MKKNWQIQNIQKGGAIKKEHNIGKTKNKIKKLWIVFGILLVLFAICFVKNKYIIPKPYTDIDDVLEKGEIKEGMRVRVAINASYGCYAKLVKHENGIFEKKEYTEEQYYAVILSDGSIISLSVSDLDDLELIGDIYLDTFNYMLDKTGNSQLHETVYFEGELEIIKQKSELKFYFEDFYNNLLKGYKEWETKPDIYYYNIRVRKEVSLYFVLLVVLGGLIVADLIVILFLAIRNNTDKKNKKRFNERIEELKKKESIPDIKNFDTDKEDNI